MGTREKESWPKKVHLHDKQHYLAVYLANTHISFAFETKSITVTEMYLEPSQISTMEPFCKNSLRLQP